MRACVRASVRACERAFVRSCVRACVCTCVRVCVCVRVWTHPVIKDLVNDHIYYVIKCSSKFARIHRIVPSTPF